MKTFKKQTLVVAFCLLVASYSKSGAQSHEFAVPKFLFPVSCTLGKDCWTVNYVDVVAEDGESKDFQCGSKTYDGHKGTDFSIGTVQRMNDGVDVLAAADGIVRRIRNSESDVFKTPDEMVALKRETKECGNGILIDHGNGYQTIYCHLRKDSVLVKPDQQVKTGEAIAKVGQSGVAEFPHLHFGVLWEEQILDPYTGYGLDKGCGQIKKSMWLDGLPMHYEAVAIYDGGFAQQPPDFEGMKQGRAQEITDVPIRTSSAAFVFWTAMYNLEKGDEINLEVTDPTGTLFVQRNTVQDKTRAQQYYYTGRKIGNVVLSTGKYAGLVKIKRNGKDIAERKFEIEVVN